MNSDWYEGLTDSEVIITLLKFIEFKKIFES